MELQTRYPAIAIFPQQLRIVAINHGQRFEQVAAHLGEAARRHRRTRRRAWAGAVPAPGVVCICARQVARQRVAHLDRRRQLLSAVFEDLRQVLACVPGGR